MGNKSGKAKINKTGGEENETGDQKQDVSETAGVTDAEVDLDETGKNEPPQEGTDVDTKKNEAEEAQEVKAETETKSESGEHKETGPSVTEETSAKEEKEQVSETEMKTESGDKKETSPSVVDETVVKEKEENVNAENKAEPVNEVKQEDVTKEAVTEHIAEKLVENEQKTEADEKTEGVSETMEACKMQVSESQPSDTTKTVESMKENESENETGIQQRKDEDDKTEDNKDDKEEIPEPKPEPEKQDTADHVEVDASKDVLKSCESSVHDVNENKNAETDVKAKEISSCKHTEEMDSIPNDNQMNGNDNGVEKPSCNDTVSKDNDETKTNTDEQTSGAHGEPGKSISHIPNGTEEKEGEDKTTPEETEEDKMEEGKVATEFRWEDGGESVELAGSFNNWGDKYRLDKKGDAFVVSLDLEPGEYTYKFFIDDEWKLNQNQPTKQDDSGAENNVIVVTKG